MEFKKFTKIPRLFRDIIITEKIDGTNALVAIDDDGSIHAGSRNRWLSLDKDNFGFCRWVMDNADELKKLGSGYHYGEWYGSGIQRRYGLDEKRFALFNVHRWSEERPACCDVVPVLYRGDFDTNSIVAVMNGLQTVGSHAVPGFMNPEGIVVYHTAGGYLFKATLESDTHKEERC